MMTLGSFMAGSKILLHLQFGVVRGWCGGAFHMCIVV